MILSPNITRFILNYMKHARYALAPTSVIYTFILFTVNGIYCLLYIQYLTWQQNILNVVRHPFYLSLFIYMRYIGIMSKISIIFVIMTFNVKALKTYVPLINMIFVCCRRCCCLFNHIQRLLNIYFYSLICVDIRVICVYEKFNISCS